MNDDRLDRIERRLDSLDASYHKLAVLHEETRDDVRRIADGLVATNERFDRVERNTDEIKSAVNSFVQTQSAINRELSDRDAHHEQRITALERGHDHV